MMSHRNCKSYSTVVSINEVACYRTERTLTGCADPLRWGSRGHHITYGGFGAGFGGGLGGAGLGAGPAMQGL